MEEQAENAKPQGGRSQLLMRIGGGVVLLAAGAAGGFFGGQVLKPTAEPTAAVATEGEGAAEAAPADGHGEAKTEAKAEGHGEAAPAEGHGEAKAEGHGEAKAAGGHGEAKAEGHSNDNGKVITNLKTFVVNLRSSGGGRVLRMEVQLESSKEAAPALELGTPKLRDTILTAVSDYTFAELEGTDGKTRLRDELLTRINGTIAPLTVDQVYFTQFVVQ
jgi:flagellar basal body-associated protein FliL